MVTGIFLQHIAESQIEGNIINGVGFTTSKGSPILAVLYNKVKRQRAIL